MPRHTTAVRVFVFGILQSAEASMRRRSRERVDSRRLGARKRALGAMPATSGGRTDGEGESPVGGDASRERATRKNIRASNLVRR